jgi:multiple sugar transport system substrate-binding protein
VKTASKFIGLASFFGISALLLSGCSADATSTSNGSTADSNDGNGSAASSITEISVATADTPWLSGYQAMVAKYEEETGIDVRLVILPANELLTAQASAAQAGSNEFDVFQINEQWTGVFYENGWLQALTSIDQDFEWDPNLMEFEGVGRWDESSGQTSLDGVPYSLPMNGNLQVLVYKKSVYEELGLSAPRSWAEVEANSKAAMSAGLVEFGFVPIGRGPAAYYFGGLLDSYGGKYFGNSQDGDYTPTINSAETRQALLQFKRLSDLGPDAPQTLGQAENVSLMQSGQGLHSILVAAAASSLEDPNSSLVTGDLGYAVLPGGKTVSGTWTVGVPTGLPRDRSQAAYDFITWLTSQSTMQAWVENGGVITRTDITTDLPAIRAIIDSEDMVVSGFRYPFAPAAYEVLTSALGEYLGGSIDVDQALVQMEDGLTTVVRDAGYLD